MKQKIDTYSFAGGIIGWNTGWFTSMLLAKKVGDEYLHFTDNLLYHTACIRRSLQDSGFLVDVVPDVIQAAGTLGLYGVGVYAGLHAGRWGAQKGSFVGKQLETLLTRTDSK